ncbi:hypothetical protein M514_24953 [Trichuris suis]|uniref:Uncharacterized protein n=1 Tax=Trichuris suis TaxID=68888 RepID=A0A085N0B7_9BILA|nr:hypothetical protein M514_24953 [Trichuris suis]
MSIHLLRDDDLLDLTRYVPPFFPLLKKLNQHGDITTLHPNIRAAGACLGPQVPRGKAAEIRGALLDILSRSNHKAASNTTAEERRILKRLRQRTDLVITKADKGNVVVLLHKGTYLEKMNELLKSDIYTPIAEDPTDVVRKTLISLLQYFEHETDDTQLPKIRNYIHYICNSQCPEIYRLPKIHKPGVPLRPVV